MENNPASLQDLRWMARALTLARRGYGQTAPNPMVGAVLVQGNTLIGEGWHRRAGEPHAEIEAIENARSQGHSLSGATLYVTLEPCSTHGRTPPCTEAIVASGIARVVAAATDPNPKHVGRGFEFLRQVGLEVLSGVRAEEANRLNESFNHWIAHRTPWVIVKAGLSLDGKIATATGESQWITGPKARAYAMKLRQGVDAVLVGINTLLSDDPKLTVRRGRNVSCKRRFILDAQARTPLHAAVLTDSYREHTTIVTTERADPARIDQLSQHIRVIKAPTQDGRIDLGWFLATLGEIPVTSLLVEGGAEVNSSFLLGGFAHRIAFFYAPMIIGGRNAPGVVGGPGALSLPEALRLRELEWKRLDPDFLLTGRVDAPQAKAEDVHGNR